ncbi:MAG: hypothetical protein ACTHQE_18450 [Thermomicrobiales bacterium]|jgi:hypothetical protein
MVAVASLLPDNPEEEASVLAVLREHPELRTFIQQASTKALEFFPGASIQLDTARYDEWDPPVTMNVFVRDDQRDDQDDMVQRRLEYVRWLRDHLAYPEDMIFVFPR